MRVSLVLVIALVIVSSGALTYLVVEMSTDIKELKDKVAELNKKQSTDTTELKAELVAIKNSIPKSEETKELAETLSTLNERLKEVDSRTERLTKTLRETPSFGSSSLLAGKEQLNKDELKKLVQEAVAERPSPVIGKIGIDDFAIKLNLNAAEKDKLEETLRRKKEEMKQILLTPTPNGSSLLDELANEIIPVLQTEGEEGVRKVFIKYFGRIMRERIPGSEKTYFEEIARIGSETKEEMKQILGEQKYNAYLALQIDDPLDKIKLPNDPIEAYLFKKMQEKGMVPQTPEQR